MRFKDLLIIINKGKLNASIFSGDLVTALSIAIMPGIPIWNLQRDPNPAEQ